MSRFLTWPKSQNVVWLALLMLAGIAGFQYIFRVIHQPLAPRTIVDLEFANTPARFVAMTTAWGAEGNTAARQSLLIDFGFMPVYALAFAGFTLLAARGAQGRVQTLGLWLTLAPLAAALLDAIENFCLLNALDNLANLSATLLTLAGISAAIKFGLLLICLLYWLITLVARFMPRSPAH